MVTVHMWEGGGERDTQEGMGTTEVDWDISRRTCTCVQEYALSPESTCKLSKGFNQWSDMIQAFETLS